MKTITLGFIGHWTRSLVLGCGALCLFDVATAEAFIRGGGVRMGGGARVTSRTAIGPRGGVYNSTTAATRYHVNNVYPGYRPVAPGSAAGVARRTVRRTARRTTYGNAYGTSYYYGPAVYALPAGCFATFWEGMSAYNCGGVMYVYTDGSYYPIEGI